MAIFNSYVSLPEGKQNEDLIHQQLEYHGVIGD